MLNSEQALHLATLLTAAYPPDSSPDSRYELEEPASRPPDPGRFLTLRDWVANTRTEPCELLFAAAGLGLLPFRAPLAIPARQTELSLALLDTLTPCDLVIRHASPADLDRLQELERLCWPATLTTPVNLLALRIERYPAGQLVLELAGKVQGVIYSQRIDSADDLFGATAETVDRLFSPHARLVQLIAINIDPAVQDRRLGDQLLEFMLIYRAVQEDVHAIVAVTRCLHFVRQYGMSLSDYISLRDVSGALADPVLRFHELHGAKIEGLVPGYRPQDVDNRGHGVLVRYRPRDRRRTDLPAAEPAVAQGSGSAFPAEILGRIIEEAIEESRDGDTKVGFDPEVPLMELGLDSAGLLKLNDKLRHRLQVTLPPAFFFRHNTALKLRQALAGRPSPSPEANAPRPRPAPAGSPLQPRPVSEVRDIAIVGLACRLPGGIDTPEDFWSLLRSGGCVVTRRPEDRWHWPAPVPDQERFQGIDFGAFLPDPWRFDAPFFRIAPVEAESMDPHQRILLEVCWEALSSSGVRPSCIAQSDTGVFVGASGGDFARLAAESGTVVEAHASTGQSMAILANRISYLFDLHGPSLVIDTACSSSLVALHSAVQSLRLGECSRALVGGINLLLHPAASLAYAAAGMLSRDGLCRTFDRGASGYVRGEGAVAVLLKPLRQAIEDGDVIHAVIQGSAVNHGGLAGGLTVPHPGQQARLIRSAWADAGIDPARLRYIETHGTGTPLGDPIEIDGIREAFDLESGRGGVSGLDCGLGSVKTNFGHLEAAAGLLGLLKVVMCLKHREWPALAHFGQINPGIRLGKDGPHLITKRTCFDAARDDRPVFVGVSSFGSGGTNAHAVLRDHASPGRAVREDSIGNFLFAFSARTERKLLEICQSYLAWLKAWPHPTLDMQPLSHWLRFGRESMPSRLVCVASSREELMDSLSRFIQTPSSLDDRISACGPIDPPSLRELARQWVDRSLADWPRENFAAPAKPDWLHTLPHYPFDRTSYNPRGAGQIAPENPDSPDDTSRSRASAGAGGDEPEATLLAPVWSALGSTEDCLAPARPPRERTYLLAASAALRERLAQRLLEDPLIVLPPTSSGAISGVTKDFIGGLGDGDRLIFAAGSPWDSALSGERVATVRTEGVGHFFALVKLLQEQGFGEKPLRLVVVTFSGRGVHPLESINPSHAALHGLSGVVAHEFPAWQVHALDLDDEAALLALCRGKLPEERPVGPLAIRDGILWQQQFTPIEFERVAPPIQQNGVYLILGGSGGIGEAWTRHLSSRYQAQVLWIGRRRLDETIRQTIDTIARSGPAPRYYTADAACPESLARVLADIRAEWPDLDGVIHALMGPFDRTIRDTPFEAFMEALKPKMDSCVHLAEGLGQWTPDFLLFLSSTVALERTGGYCAYASGCAFQDALAHSLARSLPSRILVVNSAPWTVGSGERIAAAVKTRYRNSGQSPLAAGEAIESLEQALGLPFTQVALVKVRDLRNLPFADAEHQVLTLRAAPDALSADWERDRGDAPEPPPVTLSHFANPDFDAELLTRIGQVLAQYPLHAEAGGPAELRVLPKYETWLELMRTRLAHPNAESAARLAESSALAAARRLADACLDALPRVLTGRTPATEILFPAASMALVEGVYRDNPVADFFNDVLAESLAAALLAARSARPGKAWRILEIGAGTGGTTARVLPRLGRHAASIAEYAYTDVSKRFLNHAEEVFCAQYPFVRPRLFDVGAPPAPQGLDEGGYDAIIATNTLHATPDIRATLNHAKALLRRDGLLFLNELTANSIFAHLTFGLLDGWWLARDRHFRIPYSPILNPDQWNRLLTSCGFRDIRHPCRTASALGQQIFVASSDGIAVVPSTPASLSTAKAESRMNPVSDLTGPASASPLTPGVPVPEPEMLQAPCEKYLASVMAGILRMNAAEIDPDESLGNYGIDSILTVQITEAIKSRIPEVVSTLLFEAQTLRGLSRHLIEHHAERVASVLDVAGQAGAPKPRERPPAPPAPTLSRPPAPAPDNRALCSAAGADRPQAIAIIGMSCRFPGCDNPDEFWDLLASGRSAIGEIPADRWPIEGFYEPDPDRAIAEGKSYSKWGGFLKDVTLFDSLFFSILPRDAETIDPQERLFLQAAWHALEDGGYTIERIGQEFDRSLGVFAGVTRTGFDLFGPPLWEAGDTRYPHTCFASIANRVSFFLNARGPSIPVDTMCSSSLTAIHQACRSLLDGECRLALAGGVNLYLHPSAYVGLSQLRMFARDGQCRSFGRGGNGFVAGEGVACLLLKPLDRALQDGDRVHAVIRATQVNHGGRTHGYTVPNPKAQAELIRATLDKAGVDARRVSYVEAHGTGTELGDPIEISGLTQAFRRDTADTGFCAIGSVKTNIGHLEAAAGIAGLIKVVLQMRHRQLAPSLHAEELNPRIAFTETPFRVQTTLAEWSPSGESQTGPGGDWPLLAGVSSFGAGGANAHVLLEEFRADEPETASPSEGRLPFLFSARTREQLKEIAARVLAHLDAVRRDDFPPPSPADLAYTLQTGREPLAERMAFLAGDLDEVRAGLAAYLEERDPPGLILKQGNQKQLPELLADLGPKHLVDNVIDHCYAQSIFETLAAFWVKGVNIPWRLLHERHSTGDRPPRLVSLPYYPFARTPFPLPTQCRQSQPSKLRPSSAAAKLDIPPSLPAPSPISASATSTPKATPAGEGLLLTDPQSYRLPLARSPSRPLLDLPAPRDPGYLPSPAEAAPITLAPLADGILALDFGPITAASGTVLKALENLGTAGTGTIKILILQGLERLDDTWATPSEQAGLLRALAAAPPICLAVLRGRPSRFAVSLAMGCDLAAFAEEGDYLAAALVMSAVAAPDSRIAGVKLRESGVAAAVYPDATLDAEVLSLARSVARGTAPALAELKRVFRNPEEFGERADRDNPTSSMAEPPLPLPANVAEADLAPLRTLTLRSEVARLEWLEGGIILLRLEDRASRNTSSPEFVAGVIEAFTAIGHMDDARVVVLTGFDNYFACGGTREGLLAIQQGRSRFTDEQSYLMPLLCDLPVIAAMQGHAIGAGWALGLFADLAIYAEESVYQSPYMLYGFTPGAGSTFIFPRRLGEPLAREILFSGQEYRGRELAQRHRTILARPRDRVLRTALGIARHWAEHGRNVLIDRKRAGAEAIRAAIPQVFQRELALHDRTFVGNPSVLEGIETHFRPPSPGLTAQATAATAMPIPGPQPDNRMHDLTAWLLESLGDELGIPLPELDTRSAFIDLGIDSISAVTWVRKINRHFGLSLPATVVYSHPTVADLARHVIARAPEGLLPTSTPALASVTRSPIEQASAAALSETCPAGISPASGELEAWLRASLARELLIGPEDIDGETRFVDLGLDSVNAVTWIRGINQHFNVGIAATTVYAYPSLKLLTGHIQHLIETCKPTEPQAPAIGSAPSRHDTAQGAPGVSAHRAATPPSEPVAKAVSGSRPAPEPATPGSFAVAIIGMAGQFPRAPDLQTFWENIAQGRDCISEVPANRWALADYYEPSRIMPGKTVCKWMGVLENIDQFDPLFFNISPAEAELMDPQQRLFLENSWHCIEDAGYDPLALAGSRCGVFVGCEKGDYARLTENHPDSAHGLIGESVAILPARVAYYLDLKGPCMAMDTACSASLVAINTACDNLALGHCELALAGGVCVLNGPEIHVKMSNAGMLSPDGRCYTFDQRANGFVPGEGVGVILLKPLAQAEADGDPIYAVIKAWGTNQDGRTNGITAPSPLAQAALERTVYERFGIDPRAIGHVEAHGTGTALGDPIEVEGLVSAFRAYTHDRQFCALTSVKSNIGHLATAAGVAGVIKSALALERRLLPASINHQRLNEHIDLDDSPFFVNTRLRDWRPDASGTRLAAVSSFGFSGTNAHLVLEEYSSPFRTAATAPGQHFQLFMLSARSQAQLEAYAGLLARWISGPGSSIPPEDLAVTLLASRASMEYRLAVVCRTLDELARRLDSFVAGSAGKIDGVWQGRAKSQPADREARPGRVDCENAAALTAIAAEWVEGAGQPESWPGPGRRLHGVPGYPFAHERYWFVEPVVVNKPDIESLAPRRDVPEETGCGNSQTCVPKTEPAGGISPTAGGPVPATEPLRPEWQEAPLPASHHWNALGRIALGRPLFVLCQDPDLGLAFETLLREVQNKLEPDHNFCCALITPGQAIPWADQGGVLNMIILDSSGCQDTIRYFLAHTEQLPTCLGLRVMALAPAGLESAEALGDTFLGVFRRGRDQGLLLTQPPGAGSDAAARLAVREWLAFDHSQLPGVGVIQFHLEEHGTRRLSRIPPAAPHDQALRLALDWTLKPIRRADHPPRRGTLLILASQQTLEFALTMASEARGFDQVLLVGDETVAAESVSHRLDFTDPAATRFGIQILLDTNGEITHLLDLLDLSARGSEIQALNAGRVALYQVLVGACRRLSLLHLTHSLRRFQAERIHLDGAGTYGLIRALGAEYPYVKARTIDLDDSVSLDGQTLLALVTDEFDADCLDSEICYRDGGRYGATLRWTPLPAAMPPDLRLPSERGIYVITGGTRGLGLEVARLFARSGRINLVLLGKSPLPPKSQWRSCVKQVSTPPELAARLRNLIDMDEQVRHLEVGVLDLEDCDAVQTYFAGLCHHLGPVLGVIHCAAETPGGGGGFFNTDLDGFGKIFATKAVALRNLSRAVETEALEFFATFGPMSLLVPHLARGAIPQAAAHGAIEAFNGAANLRLRREVYSLLAWPDWLCSGALARVEPALLADIVQAFERIGMRLLSRQEGNLLLAQALSDPCESLTGLAYGDVPWMTSRLETLRELSKTQGLPPSQFESPQSSDMRIVRLVETWEEIKRSGGRVSPRDIGEKISPDELSKLDPALIHRLHALAIGSQHSVGGLDSRGIAELIRQTVMDVLKLKTMDPSKPFQNYGLDSITAMVLATRLEKAIQVPVEPQALIQHGTLERLSQFLSERRAGA